MQPVILKYVGIRKDVQDSMDTFNRDAPHDPVLARKLLRGTKYWVYDPNAKTFGPSKFVGFRDLKLSDYADAIKSHGNKFDGNKTQKEIAKILGAYTQNSRLSRKLIRWGESLFVTGIFDGVDQSKWKFTSLPKQ